jgi:hypothetical protein
MRAVAARLSRFPNLDGLRPLTHLKGEAVMNIPLIVEVDWIGESSDRSTCTVFDPIPREVTYPAIRIRELFSSDEHLQAMDRIADDIPKTIRWDRSQQDLEELVPFARMGYLDPRDVGYPLATAAHEEETAVFWPYITQAAGQEALFGGLKL